MKFNQLFLGLCLLVGFTDTANAEIKSVQDPKVSVLIKASMVGNFHATTNDLSVTDKEDMLKITVPLANLTTGIELRDKHMRQDLNIENCPEATLEVPKKNITKANGTTQGNLTLNCQSHPMQFSYTTTGVDKIQVSADSIINMTTWKIPTRTYLGVGVKETLVIHVEFTAVSQ